MNTLFSSRMVALTALATGIATATTTLSAADPTPVKTAIASRGDITRYVSVPGNLRARQHTTLFAKVPGYVQKLAADTGDRVESGQILAELEVPELQADLRKFEADAKMADLDLQRLTEARKKAPDLVLPQALDKAHATADVARAGLQRTQTLLGFARITAPFAGVVTMRYVDTGAFVPAAAAGSTPQSAAMFTVMDFSTIRAQAAVPELDAVLVQTGQPVKVAVEALGGKIVEGKVTRFAHAIDEATRTMLVEAELPNGELSLRPGMYATIKVGVEKHTGTLLVPTEALAMEKASAFVFKVVEGKLRKTPTTLGFNDGTHAELLTNVTEGDTVAIVGKATFADGQAVLPASATTPAPTAPPSK